MTLADTYGLRDANPTMDDVADFVDLFTSLTDWSGNATYGASGSMTFTMSAENSFRYKQIGSLVVLQADVKGTIGGTPDTTITCDLPVVPADVNQGGGCCIYEISSARKAGIWYISSVAGAGEISFAKYDGSAFSGTGANAGFSVTALYYAGAVA